ncbi:MAG: site-specific integrase [Ruminiclostridium sp.]|nr:site-specific integrase [Ruminiclostridium sp.]
MSKNRKHGDGSFRTLKNGKIELTISEGYDIYGQRIRKRFYGNTEAECRRKYKEHLKGIGEQTRASVEYTLAEWIPLWLNTYKRNNVQSSTYDEYVYLLGKVTAHKLGKMYLTDIKPIHITDFFAGCNYSHSVRKRLRFLLHGLFSDAIDNDYCYKNPVARAQIAKKEQGEKKSYTEDQATQILEFAKTDELFGLPIIILLSSGIRSGELRALSPDKFDFQNNIIRIDTAVKRDGSIGKPKNGKPRIVPVNENVMTFIAEKLNREQPYIIDDHIITESGLRSRYTWFFDRLNKKLTEDGKPIIEVLPPHSTRHTYSTLMQKKGMPVAIVSKILGHHSLEVTGGYTHMDDLQTLIMAVKTYSLA